MDFRQMEYFVAVAEERSFTRAAERLHVTQSGLSSAIRSLERELGSPLFHRTTRTVRLSQAGLALLPKARDILDLAVAGRDAVAATSTGLQGSLRLGSEQCVAAVDVSHLLERFHRRHPGIDIVFEQAGSAELLERLREDQLDVAFVAASDSRRPSDGLRWHALAEGPLVLIGSPGHPLVVRPEVPWADLEGVTFVDFGHSWAGRALNERAFTAHGVSRRVQYTVNDVHTLLDLVRRDMGVALVPAPIARKPQAEGLAVAPMAEANGLTWRVSAVGRTSAAATTALNAFLELLSDRTTGARVPEDV